MRLFLVLPLLLASAGAALAQGLVLFPANQYGRATLNLPQSTTGMSSVQLQNVLGRNANFERLDTYREQDRFRRIALPVGRLDLLVSGPMGTGVANCTASIISTRYIITNNHCFPEGQGAVRQASLLMDFYSEDNEASARRFEVRAVPVERNADLDYAIVEVSGNPSSTFGRVALEPRDPEPGESLLIIHHPMGMPKHMTRGGCRAHAPVAVQGTDIRHRCDTLPGSSGSPILSEGSGRMIGLHYGGSPNPGPTTWNFGKRLSEISGRSRVLAAVVAEQRQQEEGASRATAASADAERQRQEAAMRAEIEQRVRAEAEAAARADAERRTREQADAAAAARAEVDRLRAQLDAELARVAALPSPAALPPPAAMPRPETPADWAAAETGLGLKPDRIREMQQALRALGHDPRGTDGNLGPGTRAAIRSWQKSRGQRETGYVSDELLRTLEEARTPVAAAVRMPPAVASPPAANQPPQPARAPVKSFRDCPECPELVEVPAGSARLASIGDVTLAAPLAIGKFEVTFEEWDACVAAAGFFSTGCRHKPDDKGWGRGRQPVVNVNWNDAQQYVAWLSQKTGRSYRLLSEAEWEYAAQAGTGQEQGARPGASDANCNGCGGRWNGRQPAPVGSFPANAFGLHDMLGNVWEWTAGCWNDTYDGAPIATTALASSNCSRALRGGTWISDPGEARSGDRRRSTASDRSGFAGFRVARTP
jgi:formylglycine-generating enzyme required for sulfatase activity